MISLVSVHTNEIYVILLLITGMIGSYLTEKLTFFAAICGGIIGFLIFLGIGWEGVLMMILFFIAGTLATSWKKSWKLSIGIAEENKGRRKAAQVFANAGVPAMLSVINLVLPQFKEVLTIMTASAFSAAAADTLSSELGSIYGKNFYNIITFRKEERGLDGVVSFEGIAIGIMTSLLIASTYALFHSWNQFFIYIIIAGTIGNLADSVMGATLERKGLVKNNFVNFSNTLVAAIIAWLLFRLDTLS